MSPSFHFGREQYELVRGSRQTLFAYLESMQPADLCKEIPGFGKGSIRNLLVHCVNTYNFWIGECALGIPAVPIEAAGVTTMNGIQELYDKVDSMLLAFFDEVEDGNQSEFNFYLGGNKTSAPAIKLFSHGITHEYHHKGQILTMSRQLGYTPVDSDIMR